MANIKVAVRIRPISEREVNITGAEIVVHTDGNEVSLTNLKVSSSKAGDSRKRTKRYGFDYCFNSSSLDSEANATQEKVYEKLGRSALDALFSGVNACLVAYGQSASGKTYTMMGPKNNPGLTPRLCEGLFFRIFEEEKRGGCYETAVSYLEIYNERVRDLLKPSSNSGGLRVREHPRLGPYVQGLTRHTVSTLGSLMSYVEEGSRARKTASTSQNPTSSRSHALLTVSLTSRSDNSTSGTVTGLEKKQHVRRGARLHLVDLAGSERAGNSNYGLHRLKEGANINKSLVALGNVISALAERGATGSGPGRRFIPYRDSALTWLLKDALGGNATTIMLATISPASGSYNETAHTLRFAQRAQSVVNRPVVNEDPVSRVIRELRAEISRLTSLLSEKAVGGEEASSCCCKRRPEVGGFSIDAEEAREDPPESIVLDLKPIAPEVDGPSSRLGSPTPSTLDRRWSSDESLSPKRPPLREPRRFGSSGSLDSPAELPIEAGLSYDRVEALALVDIPTLVAVLIKPDDNLQVGSAQIEEISTDNILESSVDAEIPGTEFDGLVTPEDPANEAPESSGSLPKENVVLKTYRTKKSSGLTSSKKFGSSESFDSLKRSEGNGLVQRSHTNIQLERSRRSSLVNVAGKAKRSRSPRGSSFPVVRRAESSGERDAAKKSFPDGEARLQKPRNPLRKQESDSPKRKISKDSSPGGPRDEAPPKLVRKGSVAGETTARTHTPIQRTNRRAEIVAAVTERLYSTKKASEEAASPRDLRSPEGTEDKLASATRMKLQDISRKMLAKRRKTCVDTQTDVASTVRVKDTASITDSVEIETRDAEMITDLHENCQETAAQGYSGISVTRVKEIATLTERFARAVRFRDVGILTEEYDDEGSSSGSLKTESRIQRKPNFAEGSTNTIGTSDSRCSASQTLPEDLLPRCDRFERVCGGCHGVQECRQVPVSCGSDRNVICITLPDMLSITIESANSLESRIAVTEGSGVSTAASTRDGEAQTEHWEAASTTTGIGSEKFSHIVPNDLPVTTRSASCQSDGKTFRIENIFKDPKSAAKTIDHSATELLPDLTEHAAQKTSLKLTNSVGTSFTPETTERSTEIEGAILMGRKIASWRELPSLKSFRSRQGFSSPLRSTRPVFSPLQIASDKIGRSSASKSAPKVDAQELKSPLLVARLISNSVEVDSNFSDDSLDPDEAGGHPGSKSGVPRLDDALCPPDVVAHTKKDVYESRIEEDFADEEVEFPRSSATVQTGASRVHDYESLVLGRNCFLPISLDSGDSGGIETPESEEGRSQFKKKVSFSNTKPPDRPLQANDARKPKPIIKNKLSTFAAVNPCALRLDDDNCEESEETRSSGSSKTGKLNSSTPLDRSTSENSFRDDISSISGSSGTVRSGTLFNSDEDSDPQSIRKREESEMKRVRFTNLLFAGERGDSGTSDSEGCENAVSDEESFCCEFEGKVPHSLFASYLDEATAFVHNMNTMNEYVNASRFFQEDKNPDEDFVEYKGRRVSLRDDTDQYLKPDDFDVPLDSYKSCLRGIAKLENCIERAVGHDKLLLDKYGIRLEPATTSHSLVDPGKDSSGPENAKTDFPSPGDFGSSVDDLTGITDEEEELSRAKKGPDNLEASIFEHLMDSANHRRRRSCAKPYFRRSTRVSDLRAKCPASYSRLGKNHQDLGGYQGYQAHQFLGDSKWYTAAPVPGSPQAPGEAVKDGGLKVPQCFLTVPDAGTPSSGSEAIGTSSESIDTVASVRNKFRYPGSPRAKLLQLVSERRQIVHRSRNGSPC